MNFNHLRKKSKIYLKPCLVQVWSLNLSSSTKLCF